MLHTYKIGTVSSKAKKKKIELKICGMLFFPWKMWLAIYIQPFGTTCFPIQCGSQLGPPQRFKWMNGSSTNDDDHTERDPYMVLDMMVVRYSRLPGSFLFLFFFTPMIRQLNEQRQMMVLYMQKKDIVGHWLLPESYFIKFWTLIVIVVIGTWFCVGRSFFFIRLVVWFS